jgi:Ca2+-binding RTX toxin-like protein
LTLGGTDASLFSLASNGVLTVGTAGLSTNTATDYSVSVTVSDGDSVNYVETFHIRTGTNNVDGSAFFSAISGTDVDFGLNGKDVMLGGDGDDAIAGGGAADTIDGGNGDDQIFGGAGADSLTGGAGSDKFIFDDASGDTITDFNANATDLIVLDHTGFASLTAGSLSAANFVANSTGTPGDGNDYIIYNTTTHQLFYDANGNTSSTGAGAPQLIATLTVTGTLDATDFLII